MRLTNFGDGYRDIVVPASRIVYWETVHARPPDGYGFTRDVTKMHLEGGETLLVTESIGQVEQWYYEELRDGHGNAEATVEQVEEAVRLAVNAAVKEARRKGRLRLG